MTKLVLEIDGPEDEDWIKAVTRAREAEKKPSEEPKKKKRRRR